jgi:hypothetical protein
MGQQVVEVCEFFWGLCGGSYHFVVDGNRLVHLSRYALSVRRGYDGYCYSVDLSAIRGMHVVRVNLSEGGEPGVVIVTLFAEDLAGNLGLGRGQERSVTILNSYELEHLGEREKRLLEDWYFYYRPMLNSIRMWALELFWRIEASKIVKIHLVHDLKYPLSFLIPYSEDDRVQSFNALAKQIYQMWIATRVLKEFGYRGDELRFESGSQKPMAVVNNYAMWYEPDLNPFTMCKSAIQSLSSIPEKLRPLSEKVKRMRFAWLVNPLGMRPDMVFTSAKTCEEFLRNPFIKLAVECKNVEHMFWELNAVSSAFTYRELYQPEHIVIASLKTVPPYIKELLAEFNTVVIDNVYPGGSGEQELITYIKHALS